MLRQFFIENNISLYHESGGIQREGPCFDAANPKLWPVKPDSYVCGTDGLLYPSNRALECAHLFKGNCIMKTIRIE
jgi:hypothetical protein